MSLLWVKAMFEMNMTKFKFVIQVLLMFHIDTGP